jgi:hypothetical protein
MRLALLLAVLSPLALAACGSDGTSNPGTDGGSGGGTDGGLPPPARGFQIKSTPVDIQAGQEITYCYYFHTPNTEDMAIKKWTSHMAPGSHHMILYTQNTNDQPDGTLSAANCGGGLGSAGNVPVWTYAAQQEDSFSALPADDGNGTPVAQMIKAGQAGFFQMHYLNSTDDVLTVHVELNAEAYDAGTPITQAAPFVTYNTQISIPAGSAAAPSTASAGGTCNVPSDAKFYVMSTHLHKQGVHTQVTDGAAMVFESNDWEHPGAHDWDASPFYTFASGKLTYKCDYSNPNPYAIHTGNSAATDEMCMAVGYFFPGTTAKLCLNSLSVN